MKYRILGAALLSAALMFGATKTNKPEPGSDEAIAAQVRHEVVTYPWYTIWDDISFRVSNGHVDLIGAVNQPFKKDDIERMVRDVPGVTGISDTIKVLPLSNLDDRLRIQVARAIYRDPVLTRYAMEPLPTIHIIVENGHVTLNGVVSTPMEKQVAGIRASSAGLSFGPVVNNLQVENPSAKKS